MNDSEYNKLVQHKLLAWYDGPILQTLINPETNELYIEYNPQPESYLAKTSPEDLIKMLKSEVPLNYAFTNGSKRYTWDLNLCEYKEILEYGSQDLFDDNVYFNMISIEYESKYISELELLIK